MRILVADDDRGVLAAYKAAFASAALGRKDSELTALAASLFSTEAEADCESVAAPDFDVVYVDQGADAVDAVEESLRAGAPFRLVFLDMRMPPGIDGKETARLIRLLDADTHLVMVTGYSDSSPVDVAKVAGPFDKLYYVAKPFEIEEVLQLARALSEKWRIERELRAARAKLEEQVELIEHGNRELAASEARVRHAAFHDALTGAPNRAAFMQDLASRMHAKSEPFAVAILDLDRFKTVNDTLGHAAGDDLVRSIWCGLNGVLPSGASAARIGGDEFGLILPVADCQAALDVCNSFVQVCTQARFIFGHSVQVGASVGLAMSLAQGEIDPIESFVAPTSRSTPPNTPDAGKRASSTRASMKARASGLRSRTDCATRSPITNSRSSSSRSSRRTRWRWSGSKPLSAGKAKCTDRCRRRSSCRSQKTGP